ncbi:hypothetical protein OXH18_20600 [Thermocoleostomius sinensis A174]|uniref:Uncharacterized protein n=2 Tax=Thermocoleostomius TaxID=3065395 RepID=A0A9E8ZJB8_9CYAN|nr:hypothetical protein OXH18_20600 [Thermocoleostomius sinensis A174]
MLLGDTLLVAAGIAEIMQLEFVSVEEFYFALTLAVKTLEEFNGVEVVDRTRSILQEKFGQPSTVAPGKQNTFNYVFYVCGYEEESSRWIVSISDWQDKLRLSSDYGWMLDETRKPTRSLQFERRPTFSQALRSHLKDWLGLPLES